MLYFKASVVQWKDIRPWRPELGLKEALIINFLANEYEAAKLRRAGGAQRPVWRGNAPKKTGARSARARTRGQNPLVKYINPPPPRCRVISFSFSDTYIDKFLSDGQNTASVACMRCVYVICGDKSKSVSTRGGFFSLITKQLHTHSVSFHSHRKQFDKKVLI
jgi:hypothetical protein